MSDQVSRSYIDCEDTSSKPAKPYQSIWMDHWGGTASNTGIAPPKVNSALSLRLESSEDQVTTKNLHLPIEDNLEPSSQRLSLSLTNFPETDHNYASPTATEERLGQMNNSSLALTVPYVDKFTTFVHGRLSATEKGKMPLFMNRCESKEPTDLTILGHASTPSFIDNKNKTDLPLFMGQQFHNIQNFSDQERFREETRTKIFTIDTTASTQSKMDIFGKFLKISSGGDPALEKDGERLQLLSSPSDGNDLTNPIQIKNESSADTDTMDMDTLREQALLSSANSFVPNKDNLLDETSGTIARDQELQILPLASIQMDIPETSKAEIQNQLSATNLLSKYQLLYPIRLNSRPHMTDPGTRWLKRLKLINEPNSLSLSTRSDPEQQQQSPRFLLGENNKRRIMIKSKSDENTPRKEEKKLNTALGRETLLSHAWVQRLCRNKFVGRKEVVVERMKGNTRKKVTRGPKKFKFETEEEIRNKQPPSIAAMALMGKSMVGGSACQIERKGSSMVWNTETL